MALRRYFISGATLFIIWATFCDFTQSQITHPTEVRALKAIKLGLKDPLNKLRRWKDSSDPCSSNWTGVICNFNPVDGYLHVVELRLLNRNLTGNIDPQIGQLSNLTIINLMWNDISGSIPKEIGSLTLLRLLLLTGNRLTGVLPNELGNLANLQRLQVDFNNISGQLPKSLANLSKVLHFHMNNNSISGEIPAELSVLPALVHFLLDNNNLSGTLPSELSQMPKLRIIQLDNNNFEGSEIPVSYANMSTLLKLSLRNCNLRGSIPDFSPVPKLLYLDLSFNQLSGSIPTNKLSNRITTIDLSNNKLGGSIPSNFSGFPDLQKLSLEGNSLTGIVPSSIWNNMTFNDDNRLILNLKNNLLSNVSTDFNPPPNVTVQVKGNPMCERANALNIAPFCEIGDVDPEKAPPQNSTSCPSQACPTSHFFEYVPNSPEPCFCAAPLRVGILLRSPSMFELRPYVDQFQEYVTKNLGLSLYQLFVDSFVWEEGPRVSVYVKLFPPFGNNSQIFNTIEIQRLRDQFATLSIPLNDTFGPYDLIDFVLLGPYEDVVLEPLKSSMSKGARVGIILGASVGGIILIFIAIVILRNKFPSIFRYPKISVSRNAFILRGVRKFSFSELKNATRGFSEASRIGRGGYGEVYKGVLTDNTVVAVKRARDVSFHSQREFNNEIEVLSRLHHRNLVALVGYCDENGEQILVYEFMPGGSLHDLLSDESSSSNANFVMRLKIALDAAQGIVYLHTEADPPIIHRDIKPHNILLDTELNAKVSDFGISKLAPQPHGPVQFTAVIGTEGYLDPVYHGTRQVTEKSDVYSLGIVFLQLLTGWAAISHGVHIVQRVVEAYELRRMLLIIDTTMGSNYSRQNVEKFMSLALKCTLDDPTQRPTMREIARELEDMDLSLRNRSNNNNNNNNARRFFSSSANSGSDLDSIVMPNIPPR